MRTSLLAASLLALFACSGAVDKVACHNDSECGSGSYCGAAGFCLPAASCSAGTHRVGGDCVADTSVASCGTAAVACPAAAHAKPTCDGATCGFACDAGYAHCENAPLGAGCTVSLLDDIANCGTCRHACTAPPAHGKATCGAGNCGTACDAGYHLVGGACVADTSASSCGPSGISCPAPANGTATCDGHSCGMACAQGYAHCSNNSSDGCETDITADVHNCGGCGIACSAGQACTLDGCVDLCSPPPADRLVAIELVPTAINLVPGTATSRALKVTGFTLRAPSARGDVTAQASFTSDDTTRVTVAPDGTLNLVAGASPGSTIVHATVAGLSAAINVRVWSSARYGQLSSLTATHAAGPNPAIGTCYPVKLTAKFSDNTSEDVSPSASWHSTWYQNDTSEYGCVRVLDQQLMDMVGCPGQTPEIGQYSDFFAELIPGGLKSAVNVFYTSGSGTCSDARVPGGLLAITVAPGAPNLAVGESVKLSASGFYSDHSTSDLSNKVGYRTCDATRADMARDGWATALTPGNALVSAKLGGAEGFATITAAAAPALGAATSLVLDPVAANIPDGARYRLKAFATFATTGTSRRFQVSRQATWTASNASTAGAPYYGAGTGAVAAGRAAFTASFSGFTQAGSVRTWDPVRLSQMSGLNFVAIGNINLTQGQCVQFHTTANFSDGTTEDTTADTNWYNKSNAFGQISPTGLFWNRGPFASNYDTLGASLGVGLPSASFVVAGGPDGKHPDDYRDPATCPP